MAMFAATSQETNWAPSLQEAATRRALAGQRSSELARDLTVMLSCEWQCRCLTFPVRQRKRKSVLSAIAPVK